MSASPILWTRGAEGEVMDETIPTSVIERCPRNDCASRDVEAFAEAGGNPGGVLWHCRKCDRPFKLVRVDPRGPKTK
jgi:hypothetical protein